MTEELKQITTERGRIYTCGDKKYFSVTTPFKIIEAPPLELWALKIGPEAAKRIATAAAGYGTGVHSVWEKICKAEIATEADIKKDVKKKYQEDSLKLLKWFNENVISVLHTEEKVRIDSIGVAGQLDTICTVKTKDGPKLAVLDLKTGKIKAKAKMQMAAYRMGASETLGIPLEDITERVVLACNKKLKNAQAYYFGIDEDDWLAYVSLVNYYRWHVSEKGTVDKKEAKKH